MKKKFIIEQLEERLMLSADFQPIPFDGGLPDELSALSVVETPLVPSTSASDNVESAEYRDELVFIDSMVSDYQKLVDNIMAQQDNGTHFEVIVLDSSRNGIEQISETLNQYENIDAVHLFSHGSEGEVQLGNTWLNLNTLDAYADSIEGWKNSLTGNADLLFYGCDVVAGENGQALVETLSILTGADVAASNDLTGHEAIGGDWNLEYVKGEIDVSIAVSNELQKIWDIRLSGAAPEGGYTAVNVIPEAQITQVAGAGGDIIITWKGIDAESNPVTLHSFQYSDDGGASWYTPSNGDDSNCFSNDWKDNGGAGWSTATTFGAATAHNFTFRTAVGSVNSVHSLSGDDQSDIQVKFILNDGTSDSAFLISESFRVDNESPTATITGGSYDASTDTLTITGTNFTTIAAPSTDITSYMDWSNLTWDINNDKGSTADISFDGSGISNLTLTNDTTLTLVFTGAKAAAIEANPDYGAAGGDDSLTVKKGFSNDYFGNKANTDDLDRGPLEIKGNPMLTVPSAPITYTTLDPATVIDSLATVTDTDSPDFDSGTLTISLSSGGTVNDELSILPGGNVTLNGFNVEVSGITVGTYSGGTGGTDLVIIWNANSTAASAQEVLRQIAFRNTSATPDTSTRIVEFDLTDGDGGTSDTVQQQVNFNAANQAPAITLPGATADFTENDPTPVIIDPGATVTDLDSLDFNTGTLTVSISVNGTANDSLSILPGGNVTLNGINVEVSGVAVGTYSGGSGGTDLVITWNANSTPANAQEVLRQIAFSNSSEDPSSNVRTIEVKITDGDGGTSLAVSQDVNVSPVNDAPSGADNTVVTIEETAYTFTVADFGFSDALDSDTFNAVKITTLPVLGTLTYNAVAVTAGDYISESNINLGLLVYTPPLDGAGSAYASFTFQVQDTGGTANGGLDLDQSPKTITIDVTAQNDDPTLANPITDQNATEDAAFNFTFAANTFNDVDTGDTLTYTATLVGGAPLPAWLSFDGATRTFSGTPANGDVGTISVEVTADDGNLGTPATDQFDITVGNTNDDPTLANPIADQNATEDAAFNFTFAANTFNDVDTGDTLTYTATLVGGAPLPAWLSFDGATRTFSGTPANGDVGTISVEVTADDGNLGTPATDQFDITVGNTNDDPTLANPIADQNATEDAAFNFTFAANTFNDVDTGDTLTYTATLVGGAPLPAWLSFDGATRTFSGTPANGDVGTISVEVTADDGNLGTPATDQFDITVGNTNDDPTLANPITDQNATEDAAFNFTFAANTFNDVDTGDTLTYTATLVGGAPLPAWLSFDGATRTFSGTPANGDVGTISVEVTADDGNLGTPATDQFDITVGNTNDDPTLANPITDQNATEDAAFNFTFAANTFNDVDTGDTLTYTATLVGGAPLPAWLSFDGATRTFSGTPANGDVGTISVEVTADDGNLGTPATDQFDITVGNTNDDPTLANPITDQNATEDAAFNFTFAANTFNDVDTGDTLTYTATLVGGAPLPAWLSFDGATRTFSGTPANGDVGTISVEVTADDGNLGTPATDQFDITVGNTNDDPTLANPITDQNATEDAAFNFTFAANTFNDVDTGDTLTYTATLVGGAPLPAWLSFDGATRTFSGTPANGDVGTISVEVTADDGNLGTPATDQFDITVGNTNDDPTLANPITDQNATEDAAFNFTFAANTFNDVDTGDTLTYTATLVGGAPLPAWLSFDGATRTFSGTPANGDVGTISVEVTADDGNLGTPATDQFDITVGNTNDDPTLANPIADQNATEDAAFNFTFAANTFNDVDTGDTLTYTATLVGGAPLPAWLSFDGATRTFSGTPANGDVGTISVEVTADDGNLGTPATDQFDITVGNTNDDPTLANPITDQNATEDAAFNFTFAANTFNDVDTGDTLTYTATLVGGAPLPAWLSFDGATRTFSGTPANGDVGTISVEVTADDGNLGTPATDQFDITVGNTNDAPQATANTVSTNEDTAYTFKMADFTFTDVESNSLVSVTITNQNLAGGTLKLNGVDVTNGDTILSADIGNLVYMPAGNANGAPLATFDFTVNDADLGSVAAQMDIDVTSVADTPQAGSTAAFPDTLSDPIVISPNASDGVEVTHFQITGITNGTLYHADGTTPINNGDYITLTQAQDGLKFQLASDSAFGSFNVRPSKDGVSVDPDSGSATPIITALSAPVVPDPDVVPDEPTEEDPEIIEDSTADDPLHDATVKSATLSNASSQKKSFIKSDASAAKSGVYQSQVTVDFKPIMERLSGTQQSESSNILSVSSLEQQFNKIMNKLPNLRTSYENLKNTLDDFRKEAEMDMQGSETVIGSAMAVSTGLSVGYVIWMIRGGMLLSSLMSSLPAWQIADPLPILKSTKNDDDDDDESLETIIKKQSGNDDKKKQGSDTSGDLDND